MTARHWSAAFALLLALCTLATVVSVAVSSGHDVYRYDGSASNAAPVRTASAATTRTTVPRAVTLAAEREIADAPRSWSWSSLITGDRAAKGADEGTEIVQRGM